MSQSDVAALGDLTEPERALVESVARGEPADLKRGIVRGHVLRELILEMRPGWRVPPAGIRITRAIIDGGLDLEGFTVSKPLLLWHSRIQGGGDKGALIIRDARLRRLGIHSCTIEGSILADRVQIESGLFIGGGLVRGGLQIRGADITGALAIEGCELGDGKSALNAAGLRVSGPLILRKSKIGGEVSLPRAHLGAGIYGEDVQISHTSLALNAESLRCEGDVLLDRASVSGGVKLTNARVGGRLAGEGLVVTGIPDSLLASGVNVGHGLHLDSARFSGTVWLDGAEIGKVFKAEGLQIDGGETAIAADIIRVGGNWDMAKARLNGRLQIPGANVDGQLRMTEARIAGAELAIRGDGARIRGGCFMSRSTITGLVRFPAAEFGNQFRLRGASLRVDQGAALLASGSSFARDVELNGGLQAIGAIVLDQCKIRGVCDLRGSALKSAAIARGGAAPPMPDVNHHMTRTDEIVVSLVDADIDRLQMPEEAENRPRGIVDLSRARAGSYDDGAAAWPPSPALRARSIDGRDIDHLVLDGFTYGHLSNPAGAPVRPGKHARRDDRVADSRLIWLEAQVSEAVRQHFKPHAWVELAKRLAAQGYHDDARAITIAKLRHERKSHMTRFGARMQGLVLDWFALYGFNPWRTVVWMTFVVLLFAGIFSAAHTYCDRPGCLDETVFVVTNRDAYTPETFARGYPEFNALAYSFDVFVPFIGFGYDDHWRPNVGWGPLLEVPLPDVGGWIGLSSSQSSPQTEHALTITVGGILYVLSVLEMIIGLVLTSLAVTGFTGLLRGGD
jgi:hypothetical protein